MYLIATHFIQATCAEAFDNECGEIQTTFCRRFLDS